MNPQGFAARVRIDTKISTVLLHIVTLRLQLKYGLPILNAYFADYCKRDRFVVSSAIRDVMPLLAAGIRWHELLPSAAYRPQNCLSNAQAMQY